jgi:hypothetical protein
MIRILILIAVVALAGNTSAGIVEICFPELTGDYGTGWLPPHTSTHSRTTTFTFPPDVQSMDELRLVLSGAWVEGIIRCTPLIGPPDTTSFTPNLSMYLKAPETFDGFFHATVRPPNGPFDQWAAIFEYCCPAVDGDLNLLLGTVISVELACEHILTGFCDALADSYGILTVVRLEALGAVPAEGSSWGGVKSLFR